MNAIKRFQITGLTLSGFKCFADSTERLRVIEYERNKLKDRLAVRIVSGELCKKRV